VGKLRFFYTRENQQFHSDLKIILTAMQTCGKYNCAMIKDDTLERNLKRIYEEAYKIEVKVEDGGKLPSKVRQTDAGFDLYATEDIKLLPGQSGKTPLNIRMKLPRNTYAEITTKSGLGSKGHSVRAGIIDEEYRGVPHVIHSNVNLILGLDQDGFPLMNTEPLVIKKGDKLAQLIMHPYSNQYFIEEVQELDMNTSRGEGGFGSTGK
jgi:dUTP pyrophosphatase